MKTYFAKLLQERRVFGNRGTVLCEPRDQRSGDVFVELDQDISEQSLVVV